VDIDGTLADVPERLLDSAGGRDDVGEILAKRVWAFCLAKKREKGSGRCV
jgi:hypothetical protein